MQFFIEAFGTKVASTRFTRMGEAAVNATPAMETIADLIFEIERAIFSGQGRRGGGSWKRDTIEWLERKQRLGLDLRINHATQTLLKAMTVRRAPGQILEIGPQFIRFGSDLPYARKVQKERPFIDFSVRDRERMTHVIKDYLMAAWRAAK